MTEPSPASGSPSVGIRALRVAGLALALTLVTIAVLGLIRPELDASRYNQDRAALFTAVERYKALAIDGSSAAAYAADLEVSNRIWDLMALDRDAMSPTMSACVQHFIDAATNRGSDPAAFDAVFAACP